MAHVIIGRNYGVDFRNITLFIFGGAAEMRNRPPTPKSEFFMAIAGPLSSFMLTIVCAVLALFVMLITSRDNQIVSLILSLGSVNFALAAFNMLPLFPLDGGRCARSIWWHKTGSFYDGTKFASTLGVYISYVLVIIAVAMMFGVNIPFFGSGVVSGLWLGIMAYAVKKMNQQELRAIRYKQRA